MKKRHISKGNHDFLKDQFSFMEQQGLLSTEKVDSLLSLYVVKTKFSFIRMLVVIGALLIGVGILSFIAGNWGGLPRLVKFSLIMLGLIGFYGSGWKLERKYPKTSRSLYYTGIFMYGAGIFLIGQMFHLASDPGNAFGIWALGILPLVIYLRDQWVGLALVILLFLYGTTGFWEDQTFDNLWMLYLAIPVIYWLNHAKLRSSELVFFFHNLLTIYTLCLTLIVLELAVEAIPILLFISGLILIFLPIHQFRHLLQWQAALLYGIGGIILTFAEYWSYLEVSADQTASLVFTLLFALMLFYLMKQRHLAAILVVCALILRFYIDFSYDFLPKSLFFVLGGIILLGFGFWFEKHRRKGRDTHDKKA